MNTFAPHHAWDDGIFPGHCDGGTATLKPSSSSDARPDVRAESASGRPARCQAAVVSVERSLLRMQWSRRKPMPSDVATTTRVTKVHVVVTFTVNARVPNP